MGNALHIIYQRVSHLGEQPILAKSSIGFIKMCG